MNLNRLSDKFFVEHRVAVAMTGATQAELQQAVETGQVAKMVLHEAELNRREERYIRISLSNREIVRLRGFTQEKWDHACRLYAWHRTNTIIPTLVQYGLLEYQIEDECVLCRLTAQGAAYLKQNGRNS